MTKLLLTHNHRTFPLASLALAFFVSLVVISPLLVRAADLTTESVLALINSDRTANNLSPLKLNEALSRAALAKADDMFAKGYFSHNSPKGETPWQWVKQSGYDYQSAGENLAINYSSAEKQHTAWMKSTTHRANILNAKYQDTGIAIKTGKMNGEDVTVTVQLFGAPAVVTPLLVPHADASAVSQSLAPSEALPSKAELNTFSNSLLTSRSLVLVAGVVLLALSLILLVRAFAVASRLLFVRQPWSGPLATR